MKSTQPSIKAKDIIQSLQIRNPSEIHVRDIAMERGAFVKEKLLEGSEARLVRNNRLGIITVSNKIPEEGRRRFAIAHELGHFELHGTSQLILCSEEDMLAWNEHKSQELEANEFAVNILMPEEIFLKLTRPEQPNMDRVRELSNVFRTTLTATALRYVELSIEPCAVVISRDGFIKWYRKSTSFNFHMRVKEKLNPNTYAFDFYNGRDLPGRPLKVPASAWLSGSVDEEAEISEHSFALQKYGVVLSLLWVCEEIRVAFRRQEDDDEEPEYDLTNPFTPDGKRWRW